MTTIPFDAPHVPVERDFAVMRRALLLALAASILLPLIAMVAFGYFDYLRRTDDALNQIERLSRVAEEQAVKVLDLNRQMSDRVSEFLGEDDDSRLVNREEDVHRYLKSVAGTLQQISAIAVFGENGDLIASSLQSPPPHVSVRDKPGFKAARDVRDELSVSTPGRGILSGANVFTTNYGRFSREGKFLGIISIALRRDYFADFYRDLSVGTSSQLTGLYRTDGTILVRFPRERSQGAVAFNDETRAFIKSHPRAGRIKSFSRVDGVQRWLSYRKVDVYPLYVIGGIETAAIWSQWRNGLLSMVAIVIGPMCGIWALVVFSLRRLKAEEQAWRDWQSETAMRESAEASSRQLRRMGALGNLVANVAHDFNNLLMVVDANMELARRKSFNNLEKEITAVQRASSSARRLARRLMSVARKQPLRKERVDVSEWLAGVEAMLITSLGEKATLLLRCPAGIGHVMVDPSELESAAINLTVNAKDAMPLGGLLTVSCSRMTAHSNHATLAPGEYIALTFTDTGIGMSEDVISRAFEPLFTTKARGEGTGLGLAQVRAMCEHAGGTAELNNNPGGSLGLAVHMILPLADSENGTEAGAAHSSAERVADWNLASDIRILMVEDNEEVAAGIVAVLEVLGGVVTHEPTADAAYSRLAAAEGMGFDLVLSDIQMPGTMNGLDLAEAVHERWPDQRLALMTGYADELSRAEEVGVVVLAKPFDMAALQGLLANCAGRNSVS
jgi:signal transduction histidine kinase